MTEFGRFEIDTTIHEPLGEVRQTKKGFIQKWLIRGSNDAQVVTVFSNDLETLRQETITVRIPGDFCFAVE